MLKTEKLSNYLSLENIAKIILDQNFVITSINKTGERLLKSTKKKF